MTKLEIYEGIISFITYGIIAKLSLKAVFSLLKSNFVSAFMYVGFALIIFATVNGQMGLWSLSKITNVVENISNLNILPNNSIRFNIRHLPIQF